MTTLNPWMKVVVPHEDVMEGTSNQADFAVDLSQVVKGKNTQAQYANPALFFQKTFITEGMKSLLVHVTKRLNGKGGEPVIQLQTGFGGGKTHSLLAVYHMVHSGDIPARDLMGLDAVLEAADCSSVPQAHFAVIDGTDIAPAQPEEKGNYKLNTLWGRLAWSLGGAEGYSLLQKSDEEGTSPGKEILIDLLNRYSPCVILVDELVAYFRQLREDDSLPCGDLGTNLTFIQTLTEAMNSCPRAILLASLPESETEAGSTKGEVIVKKLGKIFGRVHSLWKTADVEESFEIVRRRLFQGMTDVQKIERDAVCEAYRDLYVKNKDKFPESTQKGHYLERLKKSYPFHPELFDLLYEYWAQLESFQKTRGVLKLLSSVVYHLWKDKSSSFMIMPADIPLKYDDIRSSCIDVLPKGWEQVIGSDIAGKASKAQKLDNTNLRIGKYCGVTRVAADIFIATAPNVQSNKLRGIDSKRMMLGVVQPGENTGIYNDALGELFNEAHYLFDEENRYWFAITPNMNMEMKSRKANFQNENHKEELFNEIRQVLNSELRKRSLFKGVHVFPESADIPDDQALRLVVLNPDQSFSKDTDDATASARDILLNHGNQPRSNANRLIFLASDTFLSINLKNSVAAYLAWNSIYQDADAGKLNLDTNLFREIEDKVTAAKDEVRRVTIDAYSHILCPELEKDKSSMDNLEWQVLSIKSNGYEMAETIESALEDNSEVITSWFPLFLEQQLNDVYWGNGKTEVKAVDVWNDFCRYLYFPRLSNSLVFEQTLSQGVKSDQYFGIASGKQGNEYLDVRIGEDVMTPLTDSLLILPKEKALQIKADREKEKETAAAAVSRTETVSGSVPIPTRITQNSEKSVSINEDTENRKHDFYLNGVNLDPMTPYNDFDEVLDFIDQLRRNLGNKVTFTLDVKISSKDGFSETEERILKENFSNSKKYNFSIE
jgi:predicted AAA+ superfamily ATPase